MSHKVIKSHLTVKIRVFPSVADPGSGTFLTPGSQTHIFKSLGDKFLGIKFYNSLKIGTNFYLHHFKNKMFNFVKFMAPKKRYNNKFIFIPVSHGCFWIWDPGWLNIRIRDKHPGSTTLVCYHLFLQELVMKLIQIQ